MESVSSALAKEVERSKKDKRLEAKKKKAVALLRLIEMKTSEEPPAKKLCNTQDVLEQGKKSCQRAAPAHKEQSDEQGCEGKRLPDDEYARAKQAIRDRKKAAMERPKVFLILDDLLPRCAPAGDGTTEKDDSSAELELGKQEQKYPPLFMMDLQHLLMFALMKNLSSYMPRWCKLLRPSKISSVVLIALHDVSIEDFQNHPESFPFIKENFPTYVEMVSPSQYGSSLDQDLYAVPLTISQMKKYTQRPELREKVIRLISLPQTNCSDGDKVTDGSSDKPDSTESCNDTAASEGQKSVAAAANRDMVPRTSLMLNSTQMMSEGYPVPVTTSNGKYADFVFSKDRYAPVKPVSPLFALDCEMCLTCIHQNELTRVSVVNEQNEVLYDSLVKPRNRIINYLTRWSGITKAMLDPVTTRLEDVQQDLRNLLPADAILCGQSLCGDLCALKMFHPYVIDTSVIYNMSGNRNVKCGLKRLTNLFLGRSIQDSKDGHCSAEDAAATMDLVKLKLSKGLDFGDAVLGGVYFPDMKTYFLRPDSAQNVQETFHTSATNSQASAARQHAGSNSNPNAGVTDKIADTLKKVRGLEVDQRKVFFQQKGNTLMHSLFELLADNKLSVGLIGSKQLVCKYQEEPKLKTVAMETDKECYKEALALCQEKDFTWLNFTAFTNKICGETPEEEEETVNDEARKKVFIKLDKRVRKLISKLQEKSLVAVVMTGRSFRGHHYNAATFVTVT